MSNLSLNDKFDTNVKNNNKNINAVIIINSLFINIRHKLFYNKLMKKAVYKTCEFFMLFIIHLSFMDWFAFCEI